MNNINLEEFKKDYYNSMPYEDLLLKYNIKDFYYRAIRKKLGLSRPKIKRLDYIFNINNLSNETDNKPADKPYNKPADKPYNKPTDKPANKPDNKPKNIPSDKPAKKKPVPATIKIIITNILLKFLAPTIFSFITVSFITF